MAYRQRSQPYVKRQFGAVLPIVLLVLMIFLVAGTAAIQLGLIDTDTPLASSKKMQAIALAESGANAMATWIETNPDQLSEDEMNALIESILQDHEGKSQISAMEGITNGSLDVQLRRQSGKLFILSTGYFEGKKANSSIALWKSESGEWIRLDN